MIIGSILLSTGFSAAWSIAKLILITILILVLAYYSTRYIAKLQNHTLSTNNIQFLETRRIDGNKMLTIAKVGGHYLALGIGKEEVHVLCELDPEELQFSETLQKNIEDNAQQKKSFQNVLDGLKTKNSNDNSEK